ncbi:hypothetical protein A2U01_0075089, partial [Trifolium medium]|nr:hypothetical protein [Trifolium medium]
FLSDSLFLPNHGGHTGGILAVEDRSREPLPRKNATEKEMKEIFDATITSEKMVTAAAV